MITRSKKVTYDNLALRDQDYVDGVSQWFAKHVAQHTGLPIEIKQAVPPAFQPFNIGEMQVANRFVLSPMCQYSANDGDTTDWHLVHYGGRAVGGAGLMLTEMICISPEARITPGCAGLYTQKQVTAWKRITDFCHTNGQAKLCAQIGHAGRKGATQLAWEGMDQPLESGSWEIIAASPIPYLNNSVTPREANRDDMDKVIADFEQCARNADQAGFDMLEVHMAHGYLLSSFISPVTNTRTDEYGGDIASRMLFPLECLTAVRKAWPANKPISVRISACDWVDNGLSEADMLRLALMLKEQGVDIINVSTGQVTKDEDPMYGRMFQAPFADHIRNEIGIPTIVAGNISNVDQANTLVGSGRTDLVAFARPLLTNPNLILEAASRYGIEEQLWPPQYAAAKFQSGMLAEREMQEMHELRINA
jgi:anthraniloyl-CoA monooxygenase